MKYLGSYKLFESVEKLYKPISVNQWNYYTGGSEDGIHSGDAFYLNNWEPITPTEFSKINELLPGIKNSEWLRPESLNDCRLDWNFITIIKLIDEWFYFCNLDDYYQCDGLDGVVQLINDLDRDQKIS